MLLSVVFVGSKNIHGITNQFLQGNSSISFMGNLIIFSNKTKNVIDCYWCFWVSRKCTFYHINVLEDAYHLSFGIMFRYKWQFFKLYYMLLVSYLHIIKLNPFGEVGHSLLFSGLFLILCSAIYSFHMQCKGSN